MTDDRPAFVVEDGSYLSARWPGDAYPFARRFSRSSAEAERSLNRMARGASIGGTPP